VICGSRTVHCTHPDLGTSSFDGLRGSSNADLVAFLRLREAVRVGKMNVTVGQRRHRLDAAAFASDNVTVVRPTDLHLQTYPVGVVLEG
jgi:hypothetical protein